MHKHANSFQSKPLQGVFRAHDRVVIDGAPIDLPANRAACVFERRAWVEAFLELEYRGAINRTERALRANMTLLRSGAVEIVRNLTGETDVPHFINLNRAPKARTLRSWLKEYEADPGSFAVAAPSMNAARRALEPVEQTSKLRQAIERVEVDENKIDITLLRKPLGLPMQPVERRERLRRSNRAKASQFGQGRIHVASVVYAPHTPRSHFASNGIIFARTATDVPRMSAYVERLFDRQCRSLIKRTGLAIQMNMLLLCSGMAEVVHKINGWAGVQHAIGPNNLAADRTLLRGLGEHGVIPPLGRNHHQLVQPGLIARTTVVYKGSNL